MTVQIKDGKKWQTLPGTAKVKKGAYKLAEKLDDKGVAVPRVKDGKTVSVDVR
ncbi:hypothetical protein ACFV2H_38210 [Streptomyces sp. NPDC059629]|uniref:hypothetical protein n=1 Tax=Streptomyces sp. NPDC059629 TaxID=3346889 RepID=UPI0036C72425